MSIKKSAASRPGGRDARRKKRAAGKLGTHAGSALNLRIAPLGDDDVMRIHRAALRLLEEVGMGAADLPARIKNAACAHGCALTDQGRLRFPRALVEDMVARAAKTFTVHARDPAWSFKVANNRINFCTGGAAVKMLDPATRAYRPSALADLYDLARLCDRLDNLQWFARPVVVTDIQDAFALDANTIYACAAGTQKHIASSISRGVHMPRLAPMLDALRTAGWRHRACGPDRHARPSLRRGAGGAVVGSSRKGARWRCCGENIGGVGRKRGISAGSGYVSHET